ncbi:MAG: immunoglobulin domain-containing protein [Opitutaceae bacterium]|jgi:hypothetical protein
MLHRIISWSILSIALLFAPWLRAQDTTLAGWTFSQFLGAGYPSVDGSTGDPVSSIVATYSGSTEPNINDVDGTLVIQTGASGYTDAAIGSWSFANFDTSNAFDVRADTFGALSFQNSVTADGLDMALSDSAGMLLTFNLTNARWSISITGTTGYANAAGSDFTYAARGNGGAATIQWLFNGEVFATQTIAAGSFVTYAHELDPDFYSSGVIEGRLVSGSVSFDNVQFNGQLGTPPEFTTQPVGLIRLVGESATFTVAVTGASSPTYQWKKGATEIPNATGATLTLNTLTLADAGNYSVTVRSSNGITADSATATLEVRQAPQITQQPAANVANPGQDVTFEVVATGSPSPTYRWQHDEVDLVDGPGISGSGTATLSLSGVTVAAEGNYRVVVENVVSSVTSATVALSVTDLDVAPSVSTPPADTVAVEGGSAEFVVVASGAPAPSYVWKFNGEPLVDGENVSGATTRRLILANLATAQAGTYTVVIANSAGTVEVEAELVVQVPPQVISGPGPLEQDVPTGATVTYQVVATGYPVPAYQWLRNGEEIEGATTDTLTLTSVTAAADGDYAVRVSNAAGTVVSATSTLSVGTAALITSGPQSALVAAGGTATFRVTASGTPAPTYQWLRDGEEIPDATSTSLVLEGVTSADAGSYTVRVSNLFATEVSNPAVLRVAQAVSSSTPKVAQVYIPGSTLSLGTTTTYTGSLRYVWYRNGKEIVGSSGTSFFIESATFADTGVYTVKVYGVNNRLLATKVVATISISVANGYDALLRNVETDRPEGVVGMDVTKDGSFTGKLRSVDGKTYSFRGKFTFPGQPHLGQASVIIKRQRQPSLVLYLQLDARLVELNVSQAEVEASLPNAVGLGEKRLTGSAPWTGDYALVLVPQPPIDASEPVTSTVLSAKIDAKGSLRLSGSLADGTKVKATVAASAEGRYAVILQPYRKVIGFVAGELVLVSSPAGYFADVDSSGVWIWTRAATGTSPAIDLELAPALAP